MPFKIAVRWVVSENEATPLYDIYESKYLIFSRLIGTSGYRNLAEQAVEEIQKYKADPARLYPDKNLGLEDGIWLMNLEILTKRGYKYSKIWSDACLDGYPCTFGQNPKPAVSKILSAVSDLFSKLKAKFKRKK